MVALDSCCTLGVSQATFEGILLTLTGATLVCRSDLLVVSRMTALLLQDSLKGVSPVGSSLLESLRSPMLESSSAVVLVISERPTLFNKKSSSLVGFLNCANVMLLRERGQTREELAPPKFNERARQQAQQQQSSRRNLPSTRY